MRHLLASLVLTAVLSPGLASAGPDENRPTVLERLEDRFAKNPELKKLTQGPPEPMARVKWLTGKWDVTAKTYATSRTPEKIEKGTRETAIELGGRWLISRNTFPGDAVAGARSQEFLGYDPFNRYWYWQIFSSVGRGTNSALFAKSGWDEGVLRLEGTFTIYGEGASVTLFVKKLSDNEYVEMFTEIVPGGVPLPILEFHYTRKAEAGPPAAKEPAKAPAKK